MHVFSCFLLVLQNENSMTVPGQWVVMFKKYLQKAAKSLQPINKLKPLGVATTNELFRQRAANPG